MTKRYIPTIDTTERDDGDIIVWDESAAIHVYEPKLDAAITPDSVTADTGVIDDVTAETVEVIGTGGASQSDVTAPLVVASEDDTVHIAAYRASADTPPPTLALYKARGSQGSPALAAEGDDVGRLSFYGYDGAAFREAARIQADVSTASGAGDMPGMLRFYTTANGASTVTEHWRIPHNGTFRPNTTSTVDIGDATHVVQHVYAEGIAFPATQVPSAGANVQDDYEEGYWTPAITAATPGDLNVGYTAQQGWYTKKGREVTLSLRILCSSFTHTTASGSLEITGLPFTVAAYHQGAVMFDVATYSGAMTLHASADHSSYLAIYRTLSANNVAPMAITDFATATTPRIWGSITYHV